MYTEVRIPAEDIALEGELILSEQQKGMIIFAHGSGSSRFSTRNRFVAEQLNEDGYHILLFDLLTAEEDEVLENRFDIALLTRRLISATTWIRELPEYADLPVGFFGASTGAAAALDCAAALGYGIVKAVISRGGRPDMAAHLAKVKSPVLLLVGGLDKEVLKLNEKAMESIGCIKELTVIPGATHLFEEPGKLQDVTEKAMSWFNRHLKQEAEIEKDYLK